MNAKRSEGFASLAALLAAIVVSAAPAAGAPASSDKKNDDWEHSFKGHEMWVQSLDDAVARATREKKPLLVDFYSHT